MTILPLLVDQFVVYINHYNSSDLFCVLKYVLYIVEKS